ncbi:hypothetical protein Aau02nite_45420 [Amorphoplanes auranticolor]|uniref:Uncharacterized protein n=1 Tax=Actinoplanes auranticolor TaxID=47988 RepID=A0A919VPG5_9ACTN|nr:hypothetical protein Aau02nite_45420 [Actinoplanes auranticolor]
MGQTKARAWAGTAGSSTATAAVSAPSAAVTPGNLIATPPHHDRLGCYRAGPGGGDPAHRGLD